VLLTIKRIYHSLPVTDKIIFNAVTNLDTFKDFSKVYTFTLAVCHVRDILLKSLFTDTHITVIIAAEISRIS